MNVGAFVCWLLDQHVPDGRVKLREGSRDSSGYIEFQQVCARCGMDL